MKAKLNAALLSRPLLIASTLVPCLYSGLARAQAAPAPAAAAPAAPAAAAPAAPAAPPAAAPPPVAPPAPPAAAAPPPAAPPPAAPPPPPADAAAAPPPAPPPADPDAEKYKHINMGVWLRLTGVAQNPIQHDKVDRLSSNGEVELHFSNQMRKWIQWTANMVGTYGPAGGAGSPASIDGAGRIAIMDLIAQFEPDPAFNFWAGRMLVPSDRSNFSGPYFMAPWNYPGQDGPREGPFGRNDGAIVWGQFNGGLFKYYAGMFNLYGDTRPDGRFSAPLFSGRLNLSLLNPEPGFYHSSTYYGKDILAIGVGGQYQKNGTGNAVTGGLNDYGLFNADLLFEKDLMGSGVVDVEGAFFKHQGPAETVDFAYMALASYLTPELSPGYGKLQPLLRIQQQKPKTIAGVTPPTATVIDAQVGYTLDAYATRFALGIQHTKESNKNVDNALFLGVQLMK